MGEEYKTVFCRAVVMTFLLTGLTGIGMACYIGFYGTEKLQQPIIGFSRN